MLLPGAGFDVVPTDCLAARLASALPESTRVPSLANEELIVTFWVHTPPVSRLASSSASTRALATARRSRGE